MNSKWSRSTLGQEPGCICILHSRILGIQEEIFPLEMELQRADWDPELRIAPVFQLQLLVLLRLRQNGERGGSLSLRSEKGPDLQQEKRQIDTRSFSGGIRDQRQFSEWVRHHCGHPQSSWVLGILGIILSFRAWGQSSRNFWRRKREGEWDSQDRSPCTRSIGSWGPGYVAHLQDQNDWDTSSSECYWRRIPLHTLFSKFRGPTSHKKK